MCVWIWGFVWKFADRIDRRIDRHLIRVSCIKNRTSVRWYKEHSIGGGKSRWFLLREPSLVLKSVCKLCLNHSFPLSASAWFIAYWRNILCCTHILRVTIKKVRYWANIEFMYCIPATLVFETNLSVGVHVRECTCDSGGRAFVIHLAAGYTCMTLLLC